MNSDLATLKLFHLISPSLPIGAFTYSQGMEWGVEVGWIKTPDSLHDWIDAVLKESMALLELPILLRLRDACEAQDKTDFTHWSRELWASRETMELRLEEQNRARALLMLLGKLPDAMHWLELSDWRDALLQTQAAGFALASYYWKIDQRQMLNGYAWSWLENMVNVGVKLIPLGQSDGQMLLHQLIQSLPDVIDMAMSVKDEDIGAGMPAMAIASSLHETQYSRLFRS